MDFKPLTQDQYQKAIAAGFTPDQIIQNERQRKANSTGTQTATAMAPGPQNSLQDIGGKIGGPVGGIVGIAGDVADAWQGFQSGAFNTIKNTVLGIPQAALKAVGGLANMMSPGASAPLQPAIGGIESLKQKTDVKAPANLPGQIGAGAGGLAASAATFALPGGAITKGQEAVGALTKATPWIVQKLAEAGVEGVGAGATQYVASGGDKKSAEQVALGAGLLTFGTKALASAYRSMIPQTVKDNVAGMFGFTGKQIGSELASGKKVKDGTMTLANLVDMNSKDAFQIIDENGIKKAYDPKNASASETLQAYYQMMQRAYKNYTDIATKAGDAGVNLGQKELNSVISKLKDYADPKRGPEFNNKANALIRQIKAFGKRNATNGQIYFKNIKPKAIQQLIQDVNKAVAPGSDAATAEVAQTTSKALRDIMDSKIESATGAQYQEARNVYSQAKSIENEMIALVKKSLKQEGLPSTFIDGLATIDMVQGLLTGNPSLAVRGVAIGGVKATFKALRDPLIKMNRALRFLSEGDQAQSPTAQRLFGATPERMGAPISQTAPKVSVSPLSQGKIGVGTAAAIGGATAATAGLVSAGNAAGVSSVEGKNNPQTTMEQNQKLADVFAKGIANAETSIVKGDPYSYVHNNPDGSKDYGKYGINDGFFKSPGLMQRYAGEKVTVKQVLNSPELQDKIVHNFYYYWSTKGKTREEIARMWTAGENSDPKKQPRPQYIQNFTEGTTTP